MSLCEAAKTLMSGEYSRRRGYLTSVINSFNCVAITGTLSIWSFFVKWEPLLSGKNHSPELFSIEVAWASCITSLFIGLWRFYSRYLDGQILKLYPGIYISERKLLFPQICTIKTPASKQELVKETGENCICWEKVKYKEFGGRGHQWFDCISVVLIIAFAIVSISVALNLKVITISWLQSLHLIGFLLIGNIIGVVLIVVSWLIWKNQSLQWPVPNACAGVGSNKRSQAVI